MYLKSIRVHAKEICQAECVCVNEPPPPFPPMNTLRAPLYAACSFLHSDCKGIIRMDILALYLHRAVSTNHRYLIYTR